MAFNPNGTYQSFTDLEGRIYAWQGGQFYDKYGDVFSVLPSASRGTLSTGTLVLAQSAVPSSVTGTTSETTLASITIPGGMMGANGVVRIGLLLSCTNNANAKTVNVKLGATTVTAFGLAASSQTIAEAYVRNRNSTSSQSFSASQKTNSSSFTAISTGAVDMTADRVLAITGTLATTSDTTTLEGWNVKALPA